jgi:acyl-CoA dehydrogenase
MAATDLRAPTGHLALPFFDDGPPHSWPTACAPGRRPRTSMNTDDRAACRDWVRRWATAAGCATAWPPAHGGALPALDSRALVVLRETLAFHSPLADFAFAMQGLGSGAISLAGTPAQQAPTCRRWPAASKIAAFALSEPDAGSDVAAMQTVAARDHLTLGSGQNDSDFVLQGSKTWISNGGMADFYCVFAKTDAQGGSRGISAFVVDASTPGLDASRAIHVMAPHPLATLQFRRLPCPPSAQLGEVNGGFKLAMQTLDIFRASVAAAALGMARRALAEAVDWARKRRMFGQTAGRLPAHPGQAGRNGRADRRRRPAHLPRRLDARPRVPAAPVSAAWPPPPMAKMTATENAQRVIDMALQMHGGRAWKVGTPVESLYRDIRSLRIYEGATEVQQLIIGKAVLQE